MLKNFLTWSLARLKERSTWLGLIGVLSAVGITLEPAMREAIITMGVALAGGIAIVTSDKPQ